MPKNLFIVLGIQEFLGDNWIFCKETVNTSSHNFCIRKHQKRLNERQDFLNRKCMFIQMSCSLLLSMMKLQKHICSEAMRAHGVPLPWPRERENRKRHCEKGKHFLSLFWERQFTTYLVLKAHLVDFHMKNIPGKSKSGIQKPWWLKGPNHWNIKETLKILFLCSSESKQTEFSSLNFSSLA